MSSTGRTSSLSAASPLRSIKPRLLWRGSLLLADGTALPGVCFLSHLAPPFVSATSPDVLAESITGEKNNRQNEEAEAELCLALEMVRHRPLVVRAAIEPGEGATAASLPEGKDKGKKIEWRASGDIRVFIDPAERITVAYFERQFCMEDNLAATDPPRSRQVLQLALDMQSWQLSSVSQGASQSQDPFSVSYASTFHESSGSSSTLDVALFAQPAQGADRRRLMRLVLGRKVVHKPILQRSSTFGNISQRPDDPAPRSSSIAALMAVKRASPLFSLSTPLIEPRRSSSSPQSQGLSQTQPLRRGSTLGKSVSTSNILDLTPVKEEDLTGGDDEEHAASPIAPAAYKASSSRSSSVRGNHTPGRRGEKRPRPSSTISQPSLNSSALAVAGRNGSRLKSEDSSRAQASPAAETHIKREWSDGASTPLSGTFTLPGLLSSGPASSSGTTKSGALEQRNRAALKKLVHHQLLGRGLEKQDEDYIACFSLACAGTATALRHTIATQSIDRVHAAQLVATHLAMYLPAPPVLSALMQPPTTPVSAADDVAMSEAM